MSRKLNYFLAIVCAACTTGFLAPAIPTAAQTTPSAFVYIASNYSGSNNRVVGFRVAPNGQMTRISGTPWSFNLNWMAVNGKFLFGSDNASSNDYRNIYRFQIESTGALKSLGATDIQTHGSSNDTCNQGGFMTLDHTGHSLYQFVFDYECNTLEAYQAWAVNTTTGALSYLGSTTGDEYLLAPMTIAADNVWAYDLDCNFAISDMTAYKRLSNGALQNVNEKYNFPTPPPTNSYWTECFAYPTADTTNHFALDVYYPDSRNDHIATYAINTTTGDIATSSTYNNTPATKVTHVRWMSMAPSGKVLAVAGDSGLQLFNFNPSGQVTARTGLLTTAPIDMVRWDNANHIYAISNADSRVFVFNFTSSGVKEAPGSPYSVAHPVTVTVQPR
jgi:hypothetical protein